MGDFTSKPHLSRYVRQIGANRGRPSPRPMRQNHGCSIRSTLGHEDVSTTKIYTHVLDREGKAVRSPADNLLDR